jgi:hypothetical protein
MRSAIVVASIISLTVGSAFAQQEGQPSELQATQPPIYSEPATPPTTATPAIPDASPMLTEEQAKAKIEAGGYTEVSDLKHDEQGMWTATAMKEGKPVQLSLDTHGQLSVLN